MRMLLAVLAALTCAHPGVPAGVRPVAELAEPRASHGVSALPDGSLLVTGGFRKGQDGRSQIYAATSELYDPQENRVRPGPPLVHARAGHAAVTLRDGSVLLVGGWNADGPLAAVEHFHPARGRFEEVAPLAGPRGAMTATLLPDGRVVISGGTDGTRILDSTETFDPATLRWSAAGRLQSPRAAHAATLLADGRILLTGGEMRRGLVVASAEIYDPGSGSSTATGDMVTGRYKHAATATPAGVLVIGGSDERDWRGKLDTTEIYDPGTGRFRAGPRLSTARFKLAGRVLTLPDGTVAVAGGAPSIELLGLEDTHARRVVPMAAAPYFGTASRLPSGELVLIGGYDDQIRASADVWRYAL